MRRLLLLLSLVLVVVGCSSGSDSGDIAFESVLDVWTTPTGTSVWTATGEAIDSDLFCSAATGVWEGFEDEDGATPLPEELDAVFRGKEPFVMVSVESMTCDDGSGEFTLRFVSEIDPSLSDRVTKETWTITGGSGYDTTSGEGDFEQGQPDGDKSFHNGTGTITKD